MRVPYSWLREHCDPGMSAEELAERLAMTGTEVERVLTVGPLSPDGFVVGRVLAVDPHPDADRLRVCTVDTGDGERTIVCGAPNVAAGQTVAVALPGARMPGGQKLGKAKLRGVESSGMILSAAELEIAEDADGILVLEDGVAAGTALAEVLPLAEPVLELEVTPNRVDCFGVYGVAREVHAITAAPLGPEPWTEDAPAEGEGEASDYASLTVEVADLCPRFTARVFTEVTDRPVSRLAAGAPHRGRAAPDQQRRRHHQLRDAAHRAAAARFRPRPGAGRGADDPHGPRGGDDEDPRRRRAVPRRRDGSGLRPRRAFGHRRDHGRPGLGGLGLDHPGAA